MNPARWTVLGVLVALLGVMLFPTAKSYYDQRQELGDLQAQVSEQEADVTRLEREKELWSTDEYVEAQARQRLKFVKVGEKSYTVIDAEDGSGVDAETGTATGSADQPWYDQLSSSVEAADDPNATP